MGEDHFMPTKKEVCKGEFVTKWIMSILNAFAVTPVLDVGIRRVS